jgi:hypothetical protein
VELATEGSELVLDALVGDSRDTALLSAVVVVFVR